VSLEVPEGFGKAGEGINIANIILYSVLIIIVAGLALLIVKRKLLIVRRK